MTKQCLKCDTRFKVQKWKIGDEKTYCCICQDINQFFQDAVKAVQCDINRNVKVDWRYNKN